MKLKQITDKSPGTVLVEFEHETGTVDKVLSKPVSMNDLLYAMRKAERDIAYRMFGEEWRKHVGRYWGFPDSREMDMLKDAVRLRQDLFDVT